MGEQKFKCCICGQTVKGWGNNPYPVSENPDDRCCDVCNDTKVLPERLLKWYIANKDNNAGE
jgi:hypothetical protein